MLYSDPFEEESNVDRVAAGLSPIKGEACAVNVARGATLKEFVEWLYESKYTDSQQVTWKNLVTNQLYEAVAMPDNQEDTIELAIPWSGIGSKYTVLMLKERFTNYLNYWGEINLTVMTALSNKPLSIVAMGVEHGECVIYVKHNDLL